MEFQRILDNLMAFWGICDDQIESENVRNIIKVGKRVERIDLFARLERSKEDLSREIHRLTGRISKCNLNYKQEVIDGLNKEISGETLDYPKILNEIADILL